jgi:hypothetical protein
MTFRYILIERRAMALRSAPPDCAACKNGTLPRNDEVD